MSLIARIRTVLTMGQGVVKGLEESHDSRNPFELFDEWFSAAKRSGILLPEAMTLGTASVDGAPSLRQVLLKGSSEDGFDFYTNYDSRKATELDANPKAALLFHWSVLERQVRIQGESTRVTKAESEAYFRTRLRGSQIGAWASAQSSLLGDRAELERKQKEMENRFSGENVPLPPNWGGYRVKPSKFEFWQGKMNRLHDRLVFELDNGRWESHRLYP
jgi:pyridoxamine 5'-phosphate oxidase